MDLDTYTEVHTQMQTDRHSLLSLLDRFLWEFGSWCRYSSRFSPFILSHWLRLASPGPCATGRRHSSCVSNLSGLWHASATDIPYIYICIYVYIPYSCHPSTIHTIRIHSISAMACHVEYHVWNVLKWSFCIFCNILSLPFFTCQTRSLKNIWCDIILYHIIMNFTLLHYILLYNIFYYILVYFTIFYFLLHYTLFFRYFFY